MFIVRPISVLVMVLVCYCSSDLLICRSNTLLASNVVIGNPC